VSANGKTIPVYIVHWNAPDWLRSTTQTFVDSTAPTAITVIDNGPYERPLELDPSVRVVRAGSNLGYTGAANLAVKEWLTNDAEFCVIACHDVSLDPTALATLIDTARTHPTYGVLAPEPVANISSGPVLVPSETVDERGWVSGTMLLLRRACIESIGSFDEAFGSYGEDVDLCMRARAADWKVGVVKDARARAVGSVDPGFRVQMYVNQVRLRLKHAGRWQATKLLVAFPALSLADVARFLARHDRVFMQRSRSRLRAMPAAARLLLKPTLDHRTPGVA
jgi:GT2 family glycosyltransferase